MNNHSQYENLTPAELLAEYSDGRRDFASIELPEGSSLKGAILADAVFDNAWIDAIDFGGADLRGTSFQYAHVKLCQFAGSNLSGSNFRGAGIDGTTFESAKLDRATFTGATAYGHTLLEGESPCPKWKQ